MGQSDRLPEGPVPVLFRSSVRVPGLHGSSVVGLSPCHPEHTKSMDFNKTRYIPMSRRRRIYEGKAKVLYEGPEPGTLIQHFKDDATAFNAKKHQVIEGKGVLNNRISEYLFQHLNDI